MMERWKLLGVIAPFRCSTLTVESISSLSCSNNTGASIREALIL